MPTDDKYPDEVQPYRKPLDPMLWPPAWLRPEPDPEDPRA